MVAELITRADATAVRAPGEEPRPLRWTPEEFHALAEAGLLEGKSVELTQGIIVSRGGRPVRWSLEEFFQMGDSGLLEGRRAQLIEGEIFTVSPMARPHGLVLMKGERALRLLFGEEFFVQNQMPLPIALGVDPEPDLAVFRGRFEDFVLTHPTEPVLVVEASDTTLRYDQSNKASLYARAGVPDYWIVNIPERRLEIHREPIEDAQSRFFWRYNSRQVLGSDASATPLHADTSVRVLDLLP